MNILMKTGMLIIGLIVLPLRAVELLSDSQAVKRMFLTADNVTAEQKTLSAAQVASVKSLLGGKMYAMSAPEGVNEAQYTFYTGKKGADIQGIAVIEEQVDKWGPLRFIIVVDPKTGAIVNAAMCKYIDGRARNLSSRSFLKDYFGKTLADPITVGKDINAVSGATVSTEILSFMVKKVLALYKVVYGK
jgi:carbon monoxide dehydrogenase subunit G